MRWESPARAATTRPIPPDHHDVLSDLAGALGWSDGGAWRRPPILKRCHAKNMTVPAPDVVPRCYRNMPALVLRYPVMLLVLALIALGPGLPSGLSAGERGRNIGVGLAVALIIVLIWARRARRAGICVDHDGVVVKGLIGLGQGADWPNVVEFSSQFASGNRSALGGYYLTVVCNGEPEPLRTNACFYFGSESGGAPAKLQETLLQLESARQQAARAKRARYQGHSDSEKPAP